MIRRSPVVLLVVLLLIGCGGPATSATTAQQVVDAFNAGGAPVADVAPGTRPPDSTLPNSYTENLTFSISEVAPKGGQVFVCATKKNCDALYAYFDVLKGLAGPYLYQSPSGTVVVQLNRGLAPTTAAKYEAIVKGLP